MNKSKLAGAIALVAISALHYWSVPRSIWEFDESLFAAAVERYEPLLHHPPPPGYPLYIAFAKIVALFTPDAFTALLVTSILTLAAGMLAFVLAFSAITDTPTAIASTMLLYASPAMLISGTLPQSDSGAMALLALAIWACAKERPAWSGLLCAAAIGWRLQLCIAIVPMFVAMFVLMRSWRDRFIALGTFAIACAAWFVPLVVATQGPASYWTWLSGQARYYAEHDADLSRSGHSMGLIATRFLAHPWGPKWLSLPVLALAAAGTFAVRRNRRIVPLAIGSLTYLGFALATMDPADAVRYAIPSLPLIALLAAAALTKFCHPERSQSPSLTLPMTSSREPPLTLPSPLGDEPAVGRGDSTRESSRGNQPSSALLPSAEGRRCRRRMRGALSRCAGLLAIPPILLYAVGAVFYAFPLLHARATTLSPPARAAQWIHANVPKNGIVFFDAALWPHARYLLRDRRSIRNDAGVAQYGDDIATPIVLLTDGELAHRSDGVTFRWPDTDAYRKLTRGHYGVVSVLPSLPVRRFRVIAGVFPPERTHDGQLWRWLAREAIIQLPPLGATRVRLVFRTPPEYPLDENRIAVNGKLVTLRRNESVETILPVPADRRVRIVAERTFIPAQIRGANNRDRRTLSVMLTRVELLDPQPAAAGSPPPR